MSELVQELNNIFADDNIGKFHIRDLPSKRRFGRRVVALDFTKLSKAVDAMRKLDRLVFKDGAILQARITPILKNNKNIKESDQEELARYANIVRELIRNETMNAPAKIKNESTSNESTKNKPTGNDEELKDLDAKIDFYKKQTLLYKAKRKYLQEQAKYNKEFKNTKVQPSTSGKSNNSSDKGTTRATQRKRIRKISSSPSSSSSASSSSSSSPSPDSDRIAKNSSRSGDQPKSRSQITAKDHSAQNRSRRRSKTPETRGRPCNRSPSGSGRPSKGRISGSRNRTKCREMKSTTMHKSISPDSRTKRRKVRSRSDQSSSASSSRVPKPRRRSRTISPFNRRLTKLDNPRSRSYIYFYNHQSPPCVERAPPLQENSHSTHQRSTTMPRSRMEWSLDLNILRALSKKDQAILAVLIQMKSLLETGRNSISNKDKYTLLYLAREVVYTRFQKLYESGMTVVDRLRRYRELYTEDEDASLLHSLAARCMTMCLLSHGTYSLICGLNKGPRTAATLHLRNL
ncbi:uncharacterized protein LOC135084548 [Ostrinia nubilalis]|uniref:uncharacterized protein LOC135084548 n=1 Tax=Ostrinia nubilalis TaxID=29057 RepID=UPI003082352D